MTLKDIPTIRTTVTEAKREERKAKTAARKAKEAEKAALPKKRRGRPPKKEIEAKKKRPVGRPAGDKAIMDEYKARLLASPKSKKVLDKILEAALDDEHKHQGAAWKLLFDRLLPLGSFEKEIIGGGSKPQVVINVGGVSQDSFVNVTQDDDDDYIDADVIDED